MNTEAQNTTRSRKEVMSLQGLLSVSRLNKQRTLIPCEKSRLCCYIFPFASLLATGISMPTFLHFSFVIFANPFSHSFAFYLLVFTLTNPGEFSGKGGREGEGEG